MKYLFVSSHCDDAELSCAGTMAKLSKDNEVTHLAFSWCGRLELQDEFDTASEILGVQGILHDFPVRRLHEYRQQIADILIRYREYVVFTHSVHDRHPDHRAVAEESLRVFNGSLFTYIAPWNGDFEPNYFVGIDLYRKLEALKAYKSQSERAYMKPESIHAAALYNGVKSFQGFAEAFHVERLIR
jgi:LmbE family N-acetylglucosaminyl deacetylase